MDNSSQTGSMIQSFSIGNASSKGITWNGSTLAVGGDVQIGSTLASTIESGAALGTTSNQDSTSTIRSGTTSTDVGLGNVQNLNAQNQAQTGLIAGTTITGGGITLSSGGNIKGGQTAFNTGTGFFLGYESGQYVFSIGNASSKGITWNGSTLAIGGDVQIGSTLASTVESGAALGATSNQDSTSTIRSGTTSTDVGLGNVQNLNAQNQAQTGLIAGTTITGGGITLSSGGNIKGGQSAFDTGTGFFLGYESSAYKFSIGNASGNKLTWNGSALSVTGTINATAGNFTSTVSVGSGATTGTVAVGTATNKINIIGTNSDSTTKIAASNGAFEMKADGTATFANGEITFESNGDISSQTFLLEKTRLFGAGGDGAIVLKSGDCTVTDTGDGKGTKVSNASIQDARGDTVCTRSGTTWTMKGDWYTTSFEVDNSTGATTLNTNGYRLFVKGAMVIDSSCIVHNDGSDGADGGDTSNSDTSGGSTTPTAGGAGGGEAGCSLGGGPDGANGSRGGLSGASVEGSGADTYYGAHGGGGGGGGGIVFISCRTITNNGTIRSNGGDGGDGGDGGRGGQQGGNGTDGGNGSVVHVII